MLTFFKAPVNAPQLTDKREIDERYHYWRRHILLTIWLGYALFYFTRKSFNAAVPDILVSGVLTRSDIGLLATLFYITYGVSKFVSGIVSDRSNARYFMGIGLIATGIVNILFGFSTSLWAFALLWALNAFFQGWGAPVCARLLTAWYSRNERGGWWAIWNTAHNVGGALIPIVMAAAALHYSWRAGMMMAGTLAIVVGIFLCWRLRDRPQAVGLPPGGRLAARRAGNRAATGRCRADPQRDPYQIRTAQSLHLAAVVVLCAGKRGACGDQRLGQSVYVRDAGGRSGDCQHGGDDV